MTITDNLLTEDDLRLLLQDIVSRFPDAKNPTDKGGNCLYFGPNNTHCLIGQLAVEQGWNISPDDNYNPYNIAEALALSNDWPVTNDARYYLGSVQSNADEGPAVWTDVPL